MDYEDPVLVGVLLQPTRDCVQLQYWIRVREAFTPFLSRALRAVMCRLRSPGAVAATRERRWAESGRDPVQFSIVTSLFRVGRRDMHIDALEGRWKPLRCDGRRFPWFGR